MIGDVERAIDVVLGVRRRQEPVVNVGSDFPSLRTAVAVFRAGGKVGCDAGFRNAVRRSLASAYVDEELARALLRLNGTRTRCDDARVERRGR